MPGEDALSAAIADIASSRDSYAPVRIRTLFSGVLPGSDASEVFSDDVQQLLNSMVESVEFTSYTDSIRHTSSSAWTAKISMFSADLDVADFLTMSVGTNSPVSFDFDWESNGVPSGFRFHGRVVIPEIDFMPNGTSVVFTVMSDAAATSNIANRDAFVGMSYAAGSRTASQIVTYLADQLGWKTDIGGVSTIQNVDVPITQNVSFDSRLSPIEYITTTLLPAVPPVDGEGFDFYIDGDNVAHFHTRTYATNVLNLERKPTVVFNVRSPDSDVLSLKVRNGSYQAAVLGYAAAKVTTTTAQSGSTGTKPSSVGDGTRPSTDLATAVVDYGIRPRLPLSGLTAKQHETRLAQFHDYMRRQYMMIDMVVMGNKDVSLFSPIDVYLVSPSGTPHHVSGLYTVSKVKHVVSRDSWVTILGAFRGGSSPDAPEVRLADELRNQKKLAAEALRSITAPGTLGAVQDGVKSPATDDPANPKTVYLNPPISVSAAAAAIAERRPADTVTLPPGPAPSLPGLSSTVVDVYNLPAP